MASDLQANVSAAFDWCITKYTDYEEQLMCLNEAFVSPPTTRRHWLDSAYAITAVSFGVFLDSASCFVGIFCAFLALVVLCHTKKKRGKVSSFLFLQRTLVVTDLCFMVNYVFAHIVDNCYHYGAYKYASPLQEANHWFALTILRSVEKCITTVSVWLITIIAIDR